MTEVVSVVASSLAILALLAFAVSLVAFLYRTSRHRSSRAWAVATGGFLVLVLLFGGISNALSRHAEPTPGEGLSSASRGAGQTSHDATVEVSRVVDGDTIDISPSVEGRSRVRLIGMDTPEVYFGTQPYGQEASAFAKRDLDGKEVGLELDVQKIDPYGRLLAYVYLPDGRMFNETLVEEGYAQVATFPPNVKYQESTARASRPTNRRRGFLSRTRAIRTTSTGRRRRGVRRATVNVSNGKLARLRYASLATRFHNSYAYVLWGT